MKILIFSILVYNTLCTPDHDYEIIGAKKEKDEFRQWKREQRKAAEAEADAENQKLERLFAGSRVNSA